MSQSVGPETGPSDLDVVDRLREFGEREMAKETAALYAKPPTSWPEYAARLAPLLPEWAGWILWRGEIEVHEKEPRFVNGFALSDGLQISIEFRSPWPESWRERQEYPPALRITRAPEGVTVAPVTDGGAGHA